MRPSISSLIVTASSTPRGDNASGVATMLGIAEHYAKIPQAQRKRTMIFIGTEGHHNQPPGGYGREWLLANRDKFFSKTALMINAEHPAEVLTHEDAGSTTTNIPDDWYAGGNATATAAEDRGRRVPRVRPECMVAAQSSTARRRPGTFLLYPAGRRGAIQRLHLFSHRGGYP